MGFTGLESGVGRGGWRWWEAGERGGSIFWGGLGSGSVYVGFGGHQSSVIFSDISFVFFFLRVRRGRGGGLSVSEK